ncbi:hypothetical protein HN011_002189 [Eciton burchellii]|nr:hypothetical protein HN011_002189 [Eciton burchellii]
MLATSSAPKRRRTSRNATAAALTNHGLGNPRDRRAPVVFGGRRLSSIPDSRVPILIRTCISGYATWRDCESLAKGFERHRGGDYGEIGLLVPSSSFATCRSISNHSACETNLAMQLCIGLSIELVVQLARLKLRCSYLFFYVLFSTRRPCLVN